jgi:hypothetical protein
MTHELYSESDNWEVENDDQDVRGWNVVDQQGQTIGTVSDMYVDTQTETIDRLVLDNGSEIDVSSVLVEDGTIRVGGMDGVTGDRDAGYATGDAGSTSSDYVAGQRTGSAGSYGTGGASGTYGGGETGSGMGNAGTMAPGTGGTTTSSYDTAQTGTSGAMGGSATAGTGNESFGRQTDTLGASPVGGSSSGATDAWRLRRQQTQTGTDTTDMQAEKNYVEEPHNPDV